MKKKTITLTEKDATEIADTILNNVSVEVEVDVDDQELRDKWENTEVFGVIEDFIDELDFSIYPDEEMAYGDKINNLKQELVGMEVEVLIEEDTPEVPKELISTANELIEMCSKLTFEEPLLRFLKAKGFSKDDIAQFRAMNRSSNQPIIDRVVEITNKYTHNKNLYVWKNLSENTDEEVVA